MKTSKRKSASGSVLANMAGKGLLVAAVFALLGAGTVEAALSTFETAVLGDNPSAYYRFNESSGVIASDSSGNGKHADYEGSMNLGGSTSGMMGGDKAVLLDGVDDYISAPIQDWASNLGASFTIEMIFSTSATTAVEPFGARGGNDRLFMFILNTNGDSDANAHTFLRGDTTKSWDYVDTYWSDTADIADGDWHHVVLTGNVGSVSYSTYVDGAPVTVASQNLNGAGKPFIESWGATPLGIGARYNYTATDSSENMPGYYDEFAVYDYELSAQQVSDHYTAIIPEPASGALLILVGGLV